MTTPHALALTLFFSLLAVAPSHAASGERSGWHLLWSDEFDGALDSAKWRAEDAFLVKNNELQYYTPEDVVLTNGTLILRSEKRSFRGRPFSSGLVETRGKFAPLYGRFEFRAKMPRGQGVWPAIWMLPNDGSWPPEIDIAEMMGSQLNAIVMTFHYGEGADHEWDTDSYIDDHGDFTAGFHDYALEWERGALRWYVDGHERFHVTNNVPNQPCYLILNTAIGGDFPGDPDETTVFPQELVIDYVRVYGKEIADTYFLTAAGEHGRVEVSPLKDRYKKGETVTIKATPYIGYVFASWSGSSKDTNATLKLVMDGHKNLTAGFADDPHAPVIISQGKPAKASSVEEKEDFDFNPANAFDGDRTTRWSSKWSDPQWLTVDLGKKQDIAAIRLAWENAYGKDYSVDVSDDGKQWKSIYANANGKGGVEEIRVTGSGRYVRMMCKKRATDWGCSLFEFGVYAPAP